MTAIIFDMDGVLIDSQPLHYEIDIRVLKACGFDATLSHVTPYSGVGNPDRWPKYKETLLLKPTVQELIKMSEANMRDIFNETKLTAIEGITELLSNIKKLGLPTGVASASSHELIDMVLKRTGISDYFDIIVSGEDVKVGKPHPDIYLKAASMVNLPPQQCIAIEDAPSGILAAKNAGFTCIAYKNPNTHGQVFDNASYVVDKFSDAFNIIKTEHFK